MKLPLLWLEPLDSFALPALMFSKYYGVYLMRPAKVLFHLKSKIILNGDHISVTTHLLVMS